MAKLSLYAFIIPGLFLISCSRSVNQDKGVNEVLSFYGGSCTSGVGYKASTSEGKQKYFELEVRNSETLESFASEPEMPASNIAYLFYHSLSKDEKNDYDEICAIVNFKDKGRKTFRYPKEKLAIVESKMAVVEKMVNLIRNKNFEGIKQFLKPDTTHVHYDKDKLIATLAKADPQFGTIKEFLLYGFYFNPEKDSPDFLHISGALIRDKESNPFSIDIDTKATNDDIILLQYKL